MVKNFQRLEEVNLSIKYCKRCHRPLKDEISKKCGYGKVCFSKIKDINTNYLFEIGGTKNV